MANIINLIIADDHNLFIDGLKMLFNDEKDIEVVDIANDGKELLTVLRNSQADIVLLDVNMPLLNGLEAARLIRQSYPILKIIMLSTYNDDHLVEKAKLLGANGYLLKTTNKEELLQTIRLVAKGQACFPYRQTISRTSFDANDNFLKHFNLTKRELEILQHIKNNHTNQQIADKLFLSIYTVETHRKNIMQKLGLNNPTALIKFLLQNNI
jgi:two-component system, NarL family, nitrate/nitrite response regulator NarL